MTDVVTYGTLEARAADGSPVEVVRGSAFNMGDGLVAMVVTQAEYEQMTDGVARSTGLNALAQRIYAYAQEKGWWEEPRTFGDLIALCHTELSEAMEAHRAGMPPTETVFMHANGSTCTQFWPDFGYTKPHGIPSELADTIIRILDMCGHYGIDIDQIMNLKMDYNDTREYRHGGKAL